MSDEQRVTKGQRIGCAGDVGNSPGFYHLHFEVQRNGIPVDPYGWERKGRDPYQRAINNKLWVQPLKGKRKMTTSPP